METQKENKKITTMDELAQIINLGFQGNQDYMDKKFNEIDKRFNVVEKDAKEVKEKLTNVEKKLDGFIETYDKEKLPMRMEYVENVLNLPKK